MYRDHFADFSAKNLVIYGMNDRSAEDAKAWVDRENLPFRILVDQERKVALAYGIAEPGGERYVANNAEGRRPAIVIDERGKVMKLLADLKTVEDQQTALAELA